MVNSIIRLFATVAPDFQVLWLAAKDMMTPNNPYLNKLIFTGVGYPPISLFYYVPLTGLNYMIAQNIFTLISCAALILCIWISFKLAKVNNKYLLIATLIALLSFPTKFTLGMGQNNFVALVLLLSSLYFFKKDKLIISGVVLGFAVVLKTIFVYFFIFYLIKKQTKILMWASIVVILSVLLVFVIRGNFDLFTFYINDVLPPLFRFEGREIYMNQGLSGFVSRFTNEIALRKSLTLVLSLVAILYNCFVLFTKKNINLTFSFTIITLLLIDSLAWQHHFVWLVFSFILLFVTTKKIKYKLLIFLSYILVSLNLPNSMIFQSNVFYGTLILYGINILELQ